MHKFLSLTTKSFDETGAKSHQELWKKALEKGYSGLSLPCSVEITKEVQGETKKFHAIFSSATEDRHGEIVFQDFDLKAFKKNPVYIDSHNYDSIEHILGRVSPLGVKDGMLQGDIEFATMNPKGLLAEQMADAGFLNTSSVGFIPKEFDDKGNILKSELLEISAVSIPANPDALYERDVVAPVQKDVQADEPKEETEPGEVNGVDVRAATHNAILSMKYEQGRLVKVAVRAIEKIKEPSAQKRQALKAVRELMKADIGA